MQQKEEIFLNKQGDNDLTLSFMDEFNIIESSKNDKRLGTILSICGGACSMIPQNAVIVTFDYFALKFADYNVFFVMMIPLAFGLTIMSLMIYPLSAKLKIYQRLLLGNYICLILVPLLPIIAYYFPNAFGFWICMIFMFVYGLAMQLNTGGGISFTSAFPKENYTTLFFTGAALAGISCTILKIIMLSVFGSGEDQVDKMAILFFIICGTFFIITIKLINQFQQTEFSATHLSKIEGKLITNIDKIDQLEMSVIQKCDLMNLEGNSTAGSRLTDFNQLSDIGEDEQTFPIKVKALQESKEDGFTFFKNVLRSIWPIPLLLIIGQIQTAVMYPGYSISKMNLQGITPSWKTTSMAFTYTFADVIGRMSTPYLPVNEETANKVIKLRYLSCIAFIFLVQEWFPMAFRYLVYLNLFFFAFTNGWSLTLSIIVGGAKANTEQKETGSAILGVAINIGIISGMILALLLI